ncbi:cobalamin-binding protein, partial [Pelomonas sp. HMWF004]
SQAVLRRGLAGSITEVFAPLTRRVGELWMSGSLQVFEEHIFSESLQLVLRQAIQALPLHTNGGGPRVLLSTLPGESHALGLLMVEALLSLEGAVCLSLGVQTPLAQLPAAAAVHRADVVALSFSGQLPARAVLEGLAALRALLPARVEVWAGGSSRALRQAGPDGVRCLHGLDAIAPETARWRQLLESAR